MSHVLRAAIAAASLLTVPACVTLDSLGPNVSGTPRTATDSGRGDSYPPTDEPSGTTSHQRASAGNVVSLGGTETLLAWAQSQAGLDSSRGGQNLVFEQSDSRLRLVLNMLDRRAMGEVSGGSGGVQAAEARGGAWPAAAALWLSPTTVPPDVLGLDRVTLGGPAGESAGELIALQVAEIQNTPEPGTLALVGAGVGALGVVRRLRRT